MSHGPCIMAAYFHGAFNPTKMKPLVKAAKQLLKDQQFDAIAFRGMSGAMVAPVLAYALDKSLIMVRKPKHHSEEHHSHMPVEGDINTGRYLIVDDFRSTGATIRAILTDVRNFAPEARCMGVMFYHNFLTYRDPLKLTTTREMFEVANSSVFEIPPLPRSDWSLFQTLATIQHPSGT